MVSWRVSALVLLLTSSVAWAEIPTTLDRYVQSKDDSYGWTVRREVAITGGQAAELILTSQTWREIPWRHRLFVYRPPEVRDESKVLFLVAGGRWRDEYAQPAPANEEFPKEAQLLGGLANQLKTTVAVLLHVPQQPIFDGMVEDQIISYTFEQYIKTQDESWPLLLPMAKSAVRGMDAVQEYAKRQWKTDVARFTVTGASKRGWTTWLTAAVDKRVEGLAPMVIDTLNMGPQMKHQVFTWGKYSDQIKDYTERRIPQLMDTTQGKILSQIVDPFTYRERIAQPKLILLGTNDRYWPLDALNLYWDDLSGEKFVLYVPNEGHGIKDYARVFGTLAAFQRHVAGDRKLPRVDWQHEAHNGGHRLSLRSDQKPKMVLEWTAEAPTRDFRDAKWTSRTVEAEGDSYRCAVDLPASGYRAVFAECQYEGEPLPYYLSTNLRILPSASAAR